MSSAFVGDVSFVEVVGDEWLGPLMITQPIEKRPDCQIQPPLSVLEV